ncbi:CCB3/YggT [Dillenia turbinata]|uniref:CCB3/YggT n=1 Tax=Dillenia turbinata TaxID=194707 RepID=A0AAN8ZHE8_9MAGN
MASLMAPETLILRNPNPNPKFHSKKQSLSLPSTRVSFFLFSHRKPLFFSPLRSKSFHLKICASSSTTTIPAKTPTNANPLTGSTRTITTLCTLTLALSKVFSQAIQQALLNIKGIILAPPFQRQVFSTVGPLFFASLRDRPSGYLNTPLTVVASGMSKWLDIYSGVLMVRVLLSWFPNIPWDRQPLSAIRDLCDPYLNLFRNIIPPIFDTLDVSPLLAFAVLGVLGSILNNSRGSYEVGLEEILAAAMCAFLFVLLVIHLKGPLRNNFRWTRLPVKVSEINLEAGNLKSTYLGNQTRWTLLPVDVSEVKLKSKNRKSFSKLEYFKVFIAHIYPNSRVVVYNVFVLFSSSGDFVVYLVMVLGVFIRASGVVEVQANYQGSDSGGPFALYFSCKSWSMEILVELHRRKLLFPGTMEITLCIELLPSRVQVMIMKSQLLVLSRVMPFRSYALLFTFKCEALENSAIHLQSLRLI